MIEKILADNHFSLVNVRYIDEMQGKLWEAEHPKSGARLVWLQRPDENMTFSIGFRTIPTDSTGVFHILEHSVLGGSEKYPVKEPFVELLKSSLKTFLNAMTFPDKTVYPFSSRNKQDFRNLLGIYMDAVLHPIARKSSNIFRQEGWRVEMDENGQPIYQGVVYNEMKGAFSNVRDVLEHTMMRNLYPDNCYRHEAGGDPAHIPDLTYEQFCAEHAKYYHPSNALIVLDGDIDAESTLGYLDLVLSEYDRQDMVFPIAHQEALPYKEVEVPYEIGENEDMSGKTIASYGKLLCGYDEPEKLLAFGILADYLAGGSEGPLKKAIIDEKLGADLKVSLHDGMQQAWAGWQIWNTDADKLPRIKEVIHDTLMGMVEDGLDPERLKGCCSSMSFALMNRDGSGFPRGLLEVINVLESWLYGGDPAQNLMYRKTLESITAKLDTGYFEELLRSALLDMSTGVLALMVPSKELGAERVRSEQERVRGYWNGLTEAEKKASMDELEVVHAWQQSTDTPEALATIPMLKLEDLTDEPKPLMVKKDTVDNIPVLKHTTDSDLCYMDLFFEASDADPEEMPLLNMLTSLLGMMSTENYDRAGLQNSIKQNIGDLELTTSIHYRDLDKHSIQFAVRAVCLPARKADAAKLLSEILTRTQFSDTKLLADLLKQKQSGGKRSLVSSGNSYAMSRVAAMQTSAGAAKEYYTGVEYLRWLNEKCTLDEIGLSALLAHLKRLADNLFTRKRLVISVSENAADQVNTLIDSFPVFGADPVETGSFPLLPKCREGILIPAGVGFASKGTNLNRCGLDFSGAACVLSNLLRFQYLWGEIRVKGGAYGTAFIAAENGDALCMSFRDPTPGKSLGVFDNCADFADAFTKENPDLTKFILGALSDVDPLLGAAGKIHLAENRYFKGKTNEDALRIRRELRTATAEDLQRICAALRTAMQEDDSFCVVGGKEQLDACENLDTVLEILA